MIVKLIASLYSESKKYVSNTLILKWLVLLKFWTQSNTIDFTTLYYEAIHYYFIIESVYRHILRAERVQQNLAYSFFSQKQIYNLRSYKKYFFFRFENCEILYIPVFQRIFIRIILLCTSKNYIL